MKPTALLLTCLIGLAVPIVGLAQPTITVQPQSQTIVAGSTLTLSVEVSGRLEFTDPDTANHLRRFYRTVLR